MASFVDYMLMCKDQTNCENCPLRANGVCYEDFKDETIKMDRLASRWRLDYKKPKPKTYIEDIVEALPMCDHWYIVNNHLPFEFYEFTPEETDECTKGDWFKPMIHKRNNFFK